MLLEDTGLLSVFPLVLLTASFERCLSGIHYSGAYLFAQKSCCSGMVKVIGNK